MWFLFWLQPSALDFYVITLFLLSSVCAFWLLCNVPDVGNVEQFMLWRDCLLDIVWCHLVTESGANIKMKIACHLSRNSFFMLLIISYIAVLLFNIFLNCKLYLTSYLIMQTCGNVFELIFQICVLICTGTVLKVRVSLDFRPRESCHIADAVGNTTKQSTWWGGGCIPM